MEKLALTYSDLLNIDETAPIDESDMSCLEELESVLRKHGKLERFGINLLHTHFPLFEGERLVETCDPERRTLTIQPIDCRELAAVDTVQTSWRFGHPKGNLVCLSECVRETGTGRHKRTHVKRSPTG